jgi:serine/threonine protein phosphatase 1
MEKLHAHTLRWLSLAEYVPSPHSSGKIAVMGHTPQRVILDMGHLICLDTNCCLGGWLTALDVNTRQCWQVDERGMVADSPARSTKPSKVKSPKPLSTNRCYV